MARYNRHPFCEIVFPAITVLSIMQDGNLYPKAPLDRVVRPIIRFLHVEAASGIVLLLATITALVLANSRWSEGYLGFWETHVTFSVGAYEFEHSLKHLVNDGLMVIFFFVVGLEIKRELVMGELQDMRRAAFPVALALGGMVVPAAIYLSLQWGEPGHRGWGIPMATDIAFVVGSLAVLGSRVPHSLRVLLLSLAIADDVGAILVIAVGYTEHIELGWLIAAIVGIVVINLLARLGTRSFGIYTLVSLAVWLACHESGIHATIAGVVIGLMTPARSYLSTGMFGQLIERATELFHGEWEDAHQVRPARAQQIRSFQRVARETVSPLEYLENLLHPWVSFVIMPIFALANACVPIQVSDLVSPISVAVMAGLAIGKPVGILLSSWLLVRSGLGQLPAGITWKILAGGGCLAGIGFTMALFIAELALSTSVLDSAKVGVLGGSLISAVVGMVLLIAWLPRPQRNTA